MTEQRPADGAGVEHGNGAEAAVPVKRPMRTFASEPEFQRAVEEAAKDCHWDILHIPDRAYDVGIPHSGFPDLILRYRDENGCAMVIAELKHAEQPRDDREKKRWDLQKQFLRDFAGYGIPVFFFRPKHWEYIVQMLKEGPPDATGDIIEPSLPISQGKKLLEPIWDDNRIVCSFLQEVADFHYTGRGELAELRRMNPDKPDSATFWRLMARTNRLGCPDTESKWALILHGMALMVPNAESKTPVGKALFDGGDNQRKQAFYSDLRFKRLLNARGTMLRSLLSESFRMLSAARQPFDWYEMATFILNDDEGSQESARAQMARNYYSTEYERSS